MSIMTIVGQKQKESKETVLLAVMDIYKDNTARVIL